MHTQCKYLKAQLSFSFHLYKLILKLPKLLEQFQSVLQWGEGFLYDKTQVCQYRLQNKTQTEMSQVRKRWNGGTSPHTSNSLSGKLETPSAQKSSSVHENRCELQTEQGAEEVSRTQKHCTMATAANKVKQSQMSCKWFSILL